MQKIGINKSKNTNMKYFKVLEKSEIISINNIEEINTLMIKPTYIDAKLLKNINKIRLSLKVDIKVIYLKKEDTSLYVYKMSYLNYETIGIPKIIEGYYIEDPSFFNKLKKDIYVENINTKIINDEVLLSYFLVLNIGVKPTDCIAYTIDNGFGENVFLSHMNGHNLTQKTFIQNMKIKNIKWSLESSKILFIAYNFNESNIYSLENHYKNVNKIENINNYLKINNFITKNKNEIIIEYEDKNNNKTTIDKLNTRRNQVNKLINTEIQNTTSKPYYDKNNKRTYFLSKDESDKHLYSIDENDSVDIIFNYANILDYYVSYYLNNIIVKVIKDNELSLFEINIESKFITKINLNKTYEDILDVKYLSDYEDYKQIIILCKNENLSTLLLYDFKDYSLKELINLDIVTFDIDYESLSIFVVHKKGNISIVDKLDLRGTNKNVETILKVPADIKEISLKKV